MPPVPLPTLKNFEAILEKRAVLPPERANYLKWLTYFLDFCSKYSVPEAPPERVRLFIDKLREKKRTPFRQNQAAHAVSLYFETQGIGEIQIADSSAFPGSGPGEGAEASSIPEPSQFQERSLSLPQAIPLPGRSPGPGKDHLIHCASTASALASLGRRLRGYIHIAGMGCRDSRARRQIKTRHYSRKTLKTYAHWSRQFQGFLKNKSPAGMWPASRSLAQG